MHIYHCEKVLGLKFYIHSSQVSYSQTFLLIAKKEMIYTQKNNNQ